MHGNTSAQRVVFPLHIEHRHSIQLAASPLLSEGGQSRHNHVVRGMDLAAAVRGQRERESERDRGGTWVPLAFGNVPRYLTVPPLDVPSETTTF